MNMNDGQTRLTFNTDIDSEPAYSPDGTKIAFVSTRDGNWEVYTMNIDGTGQTRLTFNTGLDESPAYSPDGSKITFASNRDGNFEIYTMNSDGSGQTRLTFGDAYDILPKWGLETTASTKIGVYQDGMWYLDNDGSVTWNTGDRANGFGAIGWTPVLGDWNGDNKIEIGVYQDGVWYLDYDGSGTWNAGDRVDMLRSTRVDTCCWQLEWRRDRDQDRRLPGWYVVSRQRWFRDMECR